MAFSTRPFFFLFLLSVLVVFSMQIHARESHFFSKSPKGSPSFATVDPKKDQENQDPSFVPQTGSGYGLYGHETSYSNNNNNNNNEENATSYEPYTTPSQRSQTEDRSSEKYPKNGDNNYSYNYRNENNGETGKRRNENNYNYNYNTNAYEDEKEPQRFANRMYNNDNDNDVEREGMSDTRFMENGNYFYDVNDEVNHGHYYAKNQHKNADGRYGQNNVNVNGGRFYGNDHNEENGFRDPYDSRWEKNMVMNNEQQEFEEEP